MIHELGIIEHGPGNDTSLDTSSSHSYAYLHSQGRIRSQIASISTPPKKADLDTDSLTVLVFQDQVLCPVRVKESRSGSFYLENSGPAPPLWSDEPSIMGSDLMESTDAGWVIC